MPITQSFCYPLYVNDQVDLDAVCAAAAEIGYPAMEFWFRDDSWLDWVRTAQAHGLAVASMCGHKALGDGLNNPANHDRIEAELRESIDLAVEHSIPNLICFSGNRRDGLTDEAGITITADGLRRVAPYAQAQGITLNIELLNSKVNHPGYMADSTAWGVAVCEAVASPAVKLLYDIYHMQIMEGDLIRTIRDNIQWIGHFHTAGNPGRNDMDDTQELNYRGICAAIAETGYTGYLAHEFAPKGDPVEALRAAYEICQV